MLRAYRGDRILGCPEQPGLLEMSVGTRHAIRAEVIQRVVQFPFGHPFGLQLGTLGPGRLRTRGVRPGRPDHRR
jgi:hypothetical protein